MFTRPAELADALIQAATAAWSPSARWTGCCASATTRSATLPSGSMLPGWVHHW